MTLNRRIGLGMTIAVDSSGGTSFVTLGSVVDGAKEGAAKADTADVTILSDTYKQKAKGQVDPGELTYTVSYDPDDNTSQLLATMLGLTGVSAPNWRITYPSGSQGAGSITNKTFTGHLTGMSRETMKDKMMVCEITVTKTGNPGM